MANTSGFGAGFDEFLKVQEGTSNSQDQMSTAAPGAGVGAAIPGFEANPPSTDKSGIDPGFLDFLSGQEVKTNASDQTPQTSPESIPTAVPSPDAFEAAEANPQQTVTTAASSTTSPANNEQTAETTSPPTEATPEDKQQQQSASNDVTSPEQAEVLKEIKEKFGGRWKLVRSDPYDEYLKSTGVGLLNRQLAARGSPEQVVTVDGNNINIGIHSTFHNQNYIFKLNEETQNLVEKELQSVFCSYKDGKLILQMTPVNQGFAKVQEVERTINERGEHVVVYTFGENTCRRYYQRLLTVVA